MNRYLIGSSGMANALPNTTVRIPKDIDYAIQDGEYHMEMVNGKMVEYHPISALFPYIGKERDLDILYTLKLSHSIRDINFDKTIHDIHTMKEAGAQKIESLLQELLLYWDTVHGKRSNPDFMKRNEDFFDDLINRKFPHDTLHEMVAFGDKPMKYVKKNMDLATVNMEMFYALPEDKQLLLVQEEAGVIALERFLFTGETKNVDATLSKALKIMITRLFGPNTALYTAEHYSPIRHNKKLIERVKTLYILHT